MTKIRKNACLKKFHFEKFLEKETTFTYDGVEITTNSDEIYAECEKGESYQAIVKIATHKKNGKKLYFLENVANEPVLETVKE